MRATLRLLASVKPGRYLEDFAPTGITGLVTHSRPRPTLIYLYQSTLEKLKNVPESSVYRQSTEALTRQRLNIVESVKPPGFGAWQERVKAAVEEDPERFEAARRPDGSYAAIQMVEEKLAEGNDWEGKILPRFGNVQSSEEEFQAELDKFESQTDDSKDPELQWEAEPALEAAQVSELENKIGAGLIEEVIEVARGEHQLVDEMLKHKVWEELEEKPKPGQWTYFERQSSDES